MFTLSIGWYVVVWVFISGFLLIVPDLGLSESAASYYSNIIMIVSSFVSAILCFRTATVFERDDPMKLVWLLMGAGVLSWSIGNILYTGHMVITNEEPPYPGYPDVAFLLMPPLVVAALFTFGKAISVPPPTWGIFLSTITLITALGVSVQIGYKNLMETNADIERLVIILYMSFDPILVAATVLTASLLTGGQLAYTWWFCLVGIILYYTSNLLLAIKTAQGIYVGGTWTDLGWPLAFALIGAAAMMIYNMLSNES